MQIYQGGIPQYDSQELQEAESMAIESTGKYLLKKTKKPVGSFLSGSI